MAGRDVVAELAVNLTLETASFSSGAGVAEARAKTMEGRLNKLGGAAKSAGSNLAGMAAGFAVGLGTAAVAGIGAAAAASLDYASSLGETAQQLGVTTAELQKYRYAASQAGIEQGTMDQSLARLTKNLGLASAGNKAMAKTFSDLGINLKNTDGSFKTAGQVIPEIAEKLKGVANPAERAAILTKLFGKSGQQLLPLLSEGAKGVDDLTSAAEKLGIVISDEQIRKADEAADKWAAYKQVISSKIAIGTVTGLDALQATNDFLDKWAAGTASSVNDFKSAIHSGLTNAQNFVGQMKAVFTGLPGAVGAALSQMVTQVANALGGRLTAIIEGAKAKIEQLRMAFFNLWDKVTRRSYIPDMVDDISRQMDRLQPEMVNKVDAATAKARNSFKALQTDVRNLLNELFPEIQELKDLKADLALIQRAESAGMISPEQGTEARRRVRGIEDQKPFIGDSEPLERFEVSIEELTPVMQGLGDTALGLSAKWEDAAQAIVGMISGFIGGGKTGRFIGAVLEGGLKLASHFGAFKKFGGARAKGGPVVPGRTYLVGENGPEFANFGRRGVITPMKGGGSPSRVQIVPSALFDVVIDGRAAQVAAPMAGRAAIAGAAGGMTGIRRQAGRRIP